jgi:hypothetical protein
LAQVAANKVAANEAGWTVAGFFQGMGDPSRRAG